MGACSGAGYGSGADVGAVVVVCVGAQAVC